MVHLAIKSANTDTKGLRDLHFSLEVPTIFIQQIANDTAFGFFERWEWLRFHFVQEMRWQIRQLHNVAISHIDTVLHNILQLPYVPGPTITVKLLDHTFIKTFHGCVETIVVFAEKSVQQFRKILHSFAQRQNFYADNIEPVEKICAKAILVDSLLNVCVGSGDDSSIQCNGFCPANMATMDDPKYVLEFPSRLFGICCTKEPGEYAFADVAYDRTSFGHLRDKAKEYVGTQTALWGITAGVYLATMGPKGMQEVGETIMIRVHVSAVCRVRDGFTGQPVETAGLLCSLDDQSCRPVCKPGGYLILTDLPAGRHVLVLTAAGFQREQLELTTGGGTEELDVSMLFNTVSYSLSIGGSIHYATVLGEGREEEGNRIFANVLRADLAINITLCLLGLLFLPQVLMFLGAGTPGTEVYKNCEQLVRTQLILVPVMFCQGPFYYFVNCDNNPKLAAAALVTSNSIDVLFNYVFVVVCKMGVAGSVYSTGLGAAVMNDVMQSRQTFLVGLAGLLAGLTAAFIVLFLLILRKRLVRPIDQLTQATGAFIQNNSQDFEAGTAKVNVPEIRTGDEVEQLADSFRKMEEDMATRAMQAGTAAVRAGSGASFKKLNQQLLSKVQAARPEYFGANATGADTVGRDALENLVLRSTMLRGLTSNLTVDTDAKGRSGEGSTLGVKATKQILSTVNGQKGTRVDRGIDDSLIDQFSAAMGTAVWLLSNAKLSRSDCIWAYLGTSAFGIGCLVAGSVSVMSGRGRPRAKLLMSVYSWEL